MYSFLSLRWLQCEQNSSSNCILGALYILIFNPTSMPEQAKEQKIVFPVYREILNVYKLPL
jgi:hypothetical protein